MAEKTTAGIDRNPPQAPEFERAVLGAMLLDRDSIGIAIELLTEESFYKPAHRALFRVLTDLYDKNLPVDQLTVTEHLRQRKQLEAIGGEAAIMAIMDETMSSANIRYHCHILNEKAMLRNVIAVTSSVNYQCFDDTADPSAIMDSLEAGVVELSEKRHFKPYIRISDQVQEAYRAIRHKAEAKDSLTGIDTGFTRLNKLTAGWQKSDLIILAARPSMGKTAFALDLAKNAAEKGTGVGFFSLEMSATQLVMRMLFNEGRFDGSSLNSGKIRQEDWTRLSDACSRLMNYPIYIDDTPGLTSIELSAKAKRLKTEHDIGLLIVDYLQLMEGTSKESRQQEISSISRSMKILAKDLSIPILALSQLSRSLEQRGGDHRPMLSDLRESGAIEQDADIVMFIYRAAVYGLNPEYSIGDENVFPEDVAEIIVRKQRNGPIGTVLLHWIKENTKFAEFEYHSTDEYF